MASIIKRKKNYSVVYNYVDENGETKQKWETWHTHKEALKRKAEIENQQHTGTFLPPSNQTITEFLYDFVSLYGEKKWGVSMYDSQTALIANYINPIIGDMEVQAVTPRAVDGYIQTLQKTKSVSTKTRKAVTTYVSDKTIEKIIKLLRCAFKQAVRWEIIARNPFDNVILPKTEYAKRDIWTADMIRLALDKCTDSKLYVAMNLSFACSLRMGEILGLTWENVHISDEDIAADNAYVYIDKELTRASKRAIETLGDAVLLNIDLHIEGLVAEGDRGGVDAGNVACIFGGSSSGDRRFFRRILLPGEHDQKHHEKNQRESKKNSGVNHFFHM